jgi:hypothetical protein
VLELVPDLVTFMMQALAPLKAGAEAAAQAQAPRQGADHGGRVDDGAHDTRQTSAGCSSRFICTKVRLR